MNKIGHKITELLEEIDMTQATLSKNVGITESTISKYATGKTIPNAYAISKLADALHTSTDYLLGRTNVKAPVGVAENKYWKNLDAKENRYIVEYRKLNEENRGKLSERMSILLESQEKSTAIKLD